MQSLYKQLSTFYLEFPIRSRSGLSSCNPGDFFNLGLEGWCSATSRCVPGPTHLNKMIELPPQQEVRFYRVLLVTYSFEFRRFETKTCLKVTGHQHLKEQSLTPMHRFSSRISL